MLARTGERSPHCPPLRFDCFTLRPCGSNVIALAGTLVLLALVLLLLGLASTGLGLVYAAITVGLAALVPLGLSALHRREASRGRHVRRPTRRP